MDNDEIRGAIFLRGLGIIMYGLFLCVLVGLAGFVYWQGKNWNEGPADIVFAVFILGFPYVAVIRGSQIGRKKSNPAASSRRTS